MSVMSGGWLGFLLLGQRAAAADPFALLFPVLGMVILLLLLAAGIYLAGRWYRGKREGSDHDEELWSEFLELKRSGALTPEEYQRVRAILGKKVAIPGMPIDTGEEPEANDQ